MASDWLGILILAGASTGGCLADGAEVDAPTHEASDGVIRESPPASPESAPAGVNADPGDDAEPVRGCNLKTPSPFAVTMSWTDVVPTVSQVLEGDAIRVTGQAINDASVSLRFVVDADGTTVEHETTPVVLEAGSVHTWAISLGSLGIDVEAQQFALGLEATALIESAGHVRRHRLPYVHAHKDAEGLRIYDPDVLRQQHHAGDIHKLLGPVHDGPEGISDFNLAQVGVAQVELVEDGDVGLP